MIWVSLEFLGNFWGKWKLMYANLTQLEKVPIPFNFVFCVKDIFKNLNVLKISLNFPKRV